MWAALPTLTTPLGSSPGPLVCLRQVGFEQWWPTLSASLRFVAAVKSSRRLGVSFIRARSEDAFPAKELPGEWRPRDGVKP